MPAEAWRAIALGVLQGATEFLPVSSSGHLVIVPALLGWPDQDLTFDVVVHLATAMAVLLYFRDDWARLFLAAIPGAMRSGEPDMASRRLLGWILLASLPAVAAGLLLKDRLEGLFAAPRAAAWMLVVTGALLVVAERVAHRERGAEELNGTAALLVGVAQALAVVPGVSRSGATIAAGLAVGLRRQEAARFSFLLAAPIIVGAAGLQLLEMVAAGPDLRELLPLALGFAAAFGVGYASIGLLLAWVRRAPLYAFAAYTWLLAAWALWYLP